MKWKKKLAAMWSLRPGFSIPVMMAGGLFLVGTAVVVTYKVATSSSHTAVSHIATQSDPAWSGDQFSSRPITGSTTATSSSTPMLTMAVLTETFDEYDINEPSEPAQHPIATGASLSNHVSIGGPSQETEWPKGPIRWQSDTRLSTQIVTTDQRVIANRVSGEYQLEFPSSESQAAQSLLAGAANNSTAAALGRLMSNNNIEDNNVDFSTMGDILSLDRGVPESGFSLTDPDPIVNIIPQSDSPSPSEGSSGSGDSAPMPDVTEFNPPDADLPNGRQPHAPLIEGSRDVPEPLTMPILLVGWLLLFRARRSRLDLARVQQLLEESASFKLPPGSSDRTLAQLTSTSRRSG